MANVAKDGNIISTLLLPHYPPKHKKYFWDKERKKMFLLLMGNQREL